MSTELGRRVGNDQAARLMAMRRREQLQADAGLRDVDQPSRAQFELERALMRSPLTPLELERLRSLAGIDPVSDLGLRETEETTA